MSLEFKWGRQGRENCRRSRRGDAGILRESHQAQGVGRSVSVSRSGWCCAFLFEQASESMSFVKAQVAGPKLTAPSSNLVVLGKGLGRSIPYMLSEDVNTADTKITS